LTRDRAPIIEVNKVNNWFFLVMVRQASFAKEYGLCLAFDLFRFRQWRVGFW
jgi:hypothetical protein